MTTAPAAPPPPGTSRRPVPGTPRPGRTAYRSPVPAVLITLFALLLAGLAARTAFSLVEPVFDGAVRLEDVRRLDGSYWPLNLYLGGPGYALSWVSAAALMSLLGRGRSSVVTVGGSVLAGVGGVVFALAITAEALPFAVAAELPDEQAQALVDTLNAHLDLVIPAIGGASAAIALGVLLVLAAAWTTGAAPRWFCALGLLYLLALATLPVPGRTGATVAYLLQVALVAGLGWFGLRAGLRTAPARHHQNDHPTQTGERHARTHT